MPVVKFTETFIQNQLICPEGKSRVEFVSDERTGLYIDCRASRPNQGTFFLRYKNDVGKTCHQKIGRTSDISLSEARKKVRVLKAEITLGSDPRADAKAAKEVPTLTAFMEENYFPHARSRKRTAAKDEELYRLRIKSVFGNTRLNKLSKQKIQAFHTGLLDENLSPTSADHYVKLLRHALNLAVEWDMLKINPAAGIKLFNVDNKVEHYLNDEELKSLLHVLNTNKNRNVCLIALFLLSTGARLNEALQSKWTHIDLVNKVWRIPAATSKSKHIRSIPLNDGAIDLLQGLDTEGEFEYLFINRKTGNPYTSVHKVWDRLRKEAGLPHLRLHDLRHMYASFLVNSGRTLYEVQQILGHSDPKVTQRYAHLSTRSLQAAANSASDAIKGAMSKVT